MKKLAVIVLGKSSAGKSKTWQTLLGKTNKRKLPLYFNDDESADVFVINRSPHELNKYVGDIIEEKNGETAELPNIVLCSVRYTKSDEKTFNYFIDNGYFLYVHWLNPGYQSRKPYLDKLNIINWLQSQSQKIVVGIRAGNVDAQARVDEIKKCIYDWAKARGLCKIRSA